MTLKIRRCTYLDLIPMIPLIHSSGPAAFNFVFNVDEEHSAIDFLSFAFVRERGSFSFSKHHCAEINGTLVASLMTTTHKDKLSDFWGNLTAIFSFYGAIKGLAVCWRGLTIETMIKPPKANLLYIGHLGVVEGHKGKGIGTKLIEFCQGLAQKSNIDIIALDVSQQNPRAQELYQRMGFNIIESRSLNLNQSLHEVPAHNYMEWENKTG